MQAEENGCVHQYYLWKEERHITYQEDGREGAKWRQETHRCKLCGKEYLVSIG